MQITRLMLEGLRNLEPVALEGLAALNFFVGENGAGKTSLLEGIAIASLGRSFRSNKVQTVIHHDQPLLRVFLECQVESTGQLHRLGIERDRKNQYLIRLDGVNAQALAELSAVLPVVVLDAGSFELLDGSSSIRRRFLDWGVFHVEHPFYEAWRSFNRILKHRQALLHSQVTDYASYEPWDRELVQHARVIEGCRRDFLAKFQHHLQSSLVALDANLSQHLYYRNGWVTDRLDLADVDDAGDEHLLSEESLLYILREQFARDLKQQITHCGPHRADIQIRCGRQDVRDIYSRGQKKVLVAALKLAQASVVKAADPGKKPVLLLDDLPSELDDFHLARLLAFVETEGYQCFITAVDDRACRLYPTAKARMFHVERGKITPVQDVPRGTIDS